MLAYRSGHRQVLVALRDTAERTRLAGHTGGATVAEFSPDGDMLATTGKDGTIRLWDPAAGRQLRIIPNPNTIPAIEAALAALGLAP
jgi:WD40 repeat protein